MWNKIKEKLIAFNQLGLSWLYKSFEVILIALNAIGLFILGGILILSPFIFIFLWNLALSAVILFLYNSVMLDLFSLPILNIWQVLGIVFLIRIFSGLTFKKSVIIKRNEKN